MGQSSAGVAELADAPDLGSGEVTREGSSPFARTMQIEQAAISGLLFNIGRIRVVQTVWRYVHLSSVLCEPALHSLSEPRQMCDN